MSRLPGSGLFPPAIGSMSSSDLVHLLKGLMDAAEVVLQRLDLMA